MNYVMDIEQILKHLPHRYPFLLIDRVIAIEMGKSITAIKNVTINENYFVGHYPGKPIMPGVLILEAMAQAGGILAYKTNEILATDGTLLPYFAGVDNARFRRVVQPGDQLRLEINVLRAKKDFWKLEGFAYVGEELACSAELLSALKTNT